MGVKERKEMEREMRRNQILDAARHLLFSDGINNISISKISAQAELGVGTIYFYYKNKEEIFIALQEEGLNLLYACVLKAANRKLTAGQKLEAIAQAYYRFVDEHKDYFDIINYFLSSTTVFFQEDLKRQIDQSGNRLLLVIKDIVSDGVQDGFFKEENPRNFSIMFWAALHGLIQTKKLKRTFLGDDSHEQLYEYSVLKLIQTIKS